MKVAEIQKRELVIAIWDDDSGKSHDDFMEGVREAIKKLWHLLHTFLKAYHFNFMSLYLTKTFNFQVCIKMVEFAYFEKLGKSVSVQLKCQEKNGHVRINWKTKSIGTVSIVIINMAFSLQEWHTKMWITFSRLGSQKTRCKNTLTLEITRYIPFIGIWKLAMISSLHLLKGPEFFQRLLT